MKNDFIVISDFIKLKNGGLFKNYRATIGSPLANDKLYFETFCPNCNDISRKGLNKTANHGHLYMSSFSDYGLCFRCDTITSYKDLLFSLDENFTNNQELVYAINSFLKNVASSWKSTKSLTLNTNTLNKIKKTESKYEDLVYDYLVNTRKIDKHYHDKYGLIPNVFTSGQLKYLSCGILNPERTSLINNRIIGVLDNDEVIATGVRYKRCEACVPDTYMTGNRMEILASDTILVAESVFDIIHLTVGQFMDKRPFGVAMGNKSYGKFLKQLITNYLLLGEYNMFVLIDNPKYDTNINVESISKQLFRVVNNTNPNIKLNIGYYSKKDIIYNDGEHITGFNGEFVHIIV